MFAAKGTCKYADNCYFSHHYKVKLNIKAPSFQDEVEIDDFKEENIKLEVDRKTNSIVPHEIIIPI